MRAILVLLCFAMPASAWEFHPGQPCRLTHQASDGFVELTYDPSQPIYTIQLTRADPWQAAEVFSMQFVGPMGLAISTNRQVLSADRRTLTVTDTGFGNVLNGLQFNNSARAVLGDQYFDMALIGAREPVDRFRRCAPEAGV